MKDFQDYTTVFEKHMDQLEREAIDAYRSQYPDGLPLTEALPKISGFMALSMLRLYHTWLNQQG